MKIYGGGGTVPLTLDFGTTRIRVVSSYPVCFPKAPCTYWTRGRIEPKAISKWQLREESLDHAKNQTTVTLPKALSFYRLIYLAHLIHIKGLQLLHTFVHIIYFHILFKNLR
jgi:hypothetical protein